MKNILTAALAATMLAACGFMTPAKQYAGDVQGVSGIAVIKGFVGKPFSDDYHVTIRGYSKLDPTGAGEHKQFGLPGFTDYPSEIQVLAGEYKFQVYCFNGFTSYRPSTTLPLQMGKTYLLKCEVRGGQAFVDVHASDTY
ncbi:MAG: hypothetical protein Q7K57_45710 [Burkholderiaceae bacterium]|nr:hypothetical protein [Burkholderiaceae bacterium]